MVRQKDMVVNSLSDSFDQFKLDYTLNKKEYTLQSLMQDVQSAEKILTPTPTPSKYQCPSQGGLLLTAKIGEGPRKNFPPQHKKQVRTQSGYHDRVEPD